MSAGSASLSAKRSAGGGSVVSRSRCATWRQRVHAGVGAARAVELEVGGGRPAFAAAARISPATVRAFFCTCQPE